MGTSFFLFWTLLGSAVLVEAIADVLFKWSAIHQRTAYLWVGVALYSLGTLAWAWSLRYEYLSKAITVFTILNLIAVLTVSFTLFNEQLSPINKMGIVLGLASIVLLQW